MMRVTSLLLLALAVVMPACNTSPSASASSAPDGRPNVILVVADDLDVALFDRLERLPNLGGRRFDRFFVTTPLCCPSKVSILRGQYAHSHGVERNQPPNGGQARARELGVESSTLATWLDDAGYDTTFIGRYLVGYGRRDTDASYVPPGWDHWAGLVSTTDGYQDPVFSIDGVATAFAGTVDEQALELARVSIAAAGERPYFVMIATMAPHWPWPERRSDPAGRILTMPPVERLVEALLDETGPNTYLILTSDNGFHLKPNLGKSMPWDTDTNVPFVMWGPDVESGLDERMVANIDIAPTIAEWAGVTPPEFVEGQSMVPLSRGEDVPWRSEIQLELIGSWEAVRTTTELRIEWSDGRTEVIPID